MVRPAQGREPKATRLFTSHSLGPCDPENSEKSSHFAPRKWAPFSQGAVPRHPHSDWKPKQEETIGPSSIWLQRDSRCSEPLVQADQMKGNGPTRAPSFAAKKAAKRLRETYFFFFFKPSQAGSDHLLVGWFCITRGSARRHTFP